METWTKTCGFPLLFNFEPHPHEVLGGLTTLRSPTCFRKSSVTHTHTPGGLSPEGFVLTWGTGFPPSKDTLSHDDRSIARPPDTPLLNPSWWDPMTTNLGSRFDVRRSPACGVSRGLSSWGGGFFQGPPRRNGSQTHGSLQPSETHPRPVRNRTKPCEASRKEPPRWPSGCFFSHCCDRFLDGKVDGKKRSRLAIQASILFPQVWLKPFPGHHQAGHLHSDSDGRGSRLRLREFSQLRGNARSRIYLRVWFAIREGRSGKGFLFFQRLPRKPLGAWGFGTVPLGQKPKSPQRPRLSWPFGTHPSAESRSGFDILWMVAKSIRPS